MVTTTSSANCPRCGAAVDPALAAGVCPACLLRAVALGTAADSLPAVPWVPPAVGELAAAFPQLEIVELIGHGGMGAVYKARQKSLGRWVALKILAPQHASKADFAERFSREAKVLAEVNHPHIVTVHDFGQAGEFYFLLMEFVDGVSLRQAMRAGRFTPEQALSIVPPICEALQFAHEHGIVHRDIKPENLLLDKEGRVKIADFGIARMMRAGGETSSLPSPPGRGAGGEGSRHADIDLTQESILGTPRYMAPEQRDRPASVDHRADIYSLGVVLYEMLTGELPGPNWQPPSRQSAADVRLDQIVQRALEQNPDLRYQSATELRTQIETSITQLPPDMASQLMEKSSDEDESELGEINALMRDMTYAYSQWDKLTVIIYFVVAVSLSHLAFGFPHFSPTSHEINVLLYAFGATIVGGTVWIIARFFLRRRATAAAPQRSDEAFKTSTAPPSTLASESEPDLETTWGWHGLILALLGLLWLLDYLDVLEGKAKLFGLLGFLGIATYIEHWVIPSKKSGQSPLAGKHRDTILDRTFHRNQPHWLHAYFQTDLGRRLFVYGCFGFLGTSGWIHPSLGPLTGFFGLFGLIGLSVIVEIRHRRKSLNSTAPSFLPELSQFLGLRSVWARRFLAISWLGFFGFLGSVPGLERAAGMFGFSGFVGIATIAEFWNRNGHKVRKRWKLVSALGVLFVAIPALLMFALSRTGTHANVTIHDAEVRGTLFTFHHEVDCPPGWNVWLVLENEQAAKTANPVPGTPGPTPMTRYQAFLGSRGRVRVPLEHLPTTDQGKLNMNASIGAPEQRFELTTKRRISLLGYQTESFVYVEAALWLLPDGESPNSMTRKYGGPPYVTIEPPQKPKLGPYEAAFEQGAIELVQLSSHPRSGQAWRPNGEVSTEQGLPERNGNSWSSGKVMRELTLRVQGNDLTFSYSLPQIRFPNDSAFGSMGSSFIRINQDRNTTPPTAMLTVVTAIACPPEAREMALEVGIADGDWKTKISFDRHQNQRQFDRSSHQTPDGDWAGKVQIADPVAERYPVSFSYSDRDDYETRLVYELPDGKLVPFRDNGGQGNLRTGLTTLPVAEFDSIKRFHVQARRYQWMEFRNVSLELGHKTEVEIQDAY